MAHTLKRDVAWLLQVSDDGGKTWSCTGSKFGWSRKEMAQELLWANRSRGNMRYRLWKYKAVKR